MICNRISRPIATNSYQASPRHLPTRTKASTNNYRQAAIPISTSVHMHFSKRPTTDIHVNQNGRGTTRKCHRPQKHTPRNTALILAQFKIQHNKLRPRAKNSRAPLISNYSTKINTLAGFFVCTDVLASPYAISSTQVLSDF